MSQIENRRIISSKVLWKGRDMLLCREDSLQPPPQPWKKKKTRPDFSTCWSTAHINSAVCSWPSWPDLKDEISFYFGNFPAWYTQYLKAFWKHVKSIEPRKKNLLLSIIYTGWFIGILMMVYETVYLGRISSPILPNQPGALFSLPNSFWNLFLTNQFELVTYKVEPGGSIAYGSDSYVIHISLEEFWDQHVLK